MEYVEEPLISCELREAPLPVLLEASQHILTLVEWLLSLYATDKMLDTIGCYAVAEVIRECV